MLEVIVLIFLTRRVGEIVEEKGRRSGWYKALAVVLWIGGEAIGALVGLAVSGHFDSGKVLMRIFCVLLGVAAGAALAFVIAKSLSPVAAYNTPPPPPTFG
ncbi:MAG TPA: hypothetical protein VF064_12370 [Pyrinomonadaceae bacterium]